MQLVSRRCGRARSGAGQCPRRPSGDWERSAAFSWPELPFGTKKHEGGEDVDELSPDAVAVEYIRHGRREFVLEGDQMMVVEKRKKSTLGQRVWDRLLRYFLPVGYPASVGPDYKDYTLWRLSAFFWGGCVGVFSTQGLLLAVGVGRPSAAPLAAALQWVIRDGVGRSGRMLFSQIGTGFDAETKQHRLAAAVVLNLACTLESLSPLFPAAFLPIACVANLAKGASTIAAASTRGAIYRSFMRRENLGDITAKQETVGVAGDLAGTALGIGLSRATAQSFLYSSVAFATVSMLHLFSVYREVKALQLNNLNRQRAHMLIREYLKTDVVPPVEVLNRQERVLQKPWLDSLHAPNVLLAARLRDCASDKEALTYLINLYRKEKYILTSRKDAQSRDFLKAFLQAGQFWEMYLDKGVRSSRNRELVEESYRLTQLKFKSFLREAEKSGWQTNSVLLRPVGRRVVWGDAIR